LIWKGIPSSNSLRNDFGVPEDISIIFPSL